MNGNAILAEIRQFDANLCHKDFFLTWAKSHVELELILKTAQILRSLYARKVSCKLFDSGLAISNFRENSTRTRFSFAATANLPGLAVQDLDEGKSQIAHGETVQETANMISFLSEVIGVRDDMYLGAGYTYQVEVANALQYGYENGVFPQRPCDHPTPTMAGFAWLIEGTRGPAPEGNEERKTVKSKRAASESVMGQSSEGVKNHPQRTGPLNNDFKTDKFMNAKTSEIERNQFVVSFVF